MGARNSSRRVWSRGVAREGPDGIRTRILSFNRRVLSDQLLTRTMIREGVEPSTCGLRIRRSNRLSYQTEMTRRPTAGRRYRRPRGAAPGCLRAKERTHSKTTGNAQHAPILLPTEGASIHTKAGLAFEWFLVVKRFIGSLRHARSADRIGVVDELGRVKAFEPRKNATQPHRSLRWPMVFDAARRRSNGRPGRTRPGRPSVRGRGEPRRGTLKV